MQDPRHRPPPRLGHRMRQALALVLATLTTSHAKAVAATTAVAGATAGMAGLDPLAFVFAALGAMVVIVKFPAVTRMHGMTNAVISVCIGGLGAPTVADFLSLKTDLYFNALFVAFVMSALWPVAASAAQQVWPALRGRLEKMIGGN